MKKLILLAGLLLAAGTLMADPVAVDIGENKFILPLQVVNGVQLYSFEEGKGFPALETVLIQRGKFRLTAGAAAVLGSSDNVPFGSLQTRLSPVFFDTSDNALWFGVWGGKPSNRKEWLVGLSGSIPLW